ncbi:MAG: hypothetical protein CM15mP36_11700 [Flavobacteriales bacterium]|nr:MAG: hypothetical protein CM15mP36_11700 [Flavobacteriales bacterium]
MIKKKDFSPIYLNNVSFLSGPTETITIGIFNCVSRKLI